MAERYGRCKCGLPSLPGFSNRHGPCSRHYNEGQFGKEWADKCAAKKVTIVHDEKEGKRLTYVGLWPEEAMRSAYAQYVRGDWLTWKYDQYNEMVKRATKNRLVAGPAYKGGPRLWCDWRETRSGPYKEVEDESHSRVL